MSQRQPPSLQRIGVVMLGVADVERSLAFYRDQLGLTVQMVHEGFAFLDGGGVTLGLSKELAKVADPVAGAVEIVFSVPDVHVAHRALLERGVEFKREPRQVTQRDWAAHFTDPDGHHLSIFGPPGEGK